MLPFLFPNDEAAGYDQAEGQGQREQAAVEVADQKDRAPQEE